MMSTKEKAIELAAKYNHLIHDGWEYAEPSESAKEAAIICVDEIIEANPVEWFKKENVLDEETGEYTDVYTCSSTRRYWNEVKEEIKKL